jgi:hypothetical protein
MTPEEKPAFGKLLSTLFGAHAKPLSEGMISGYWKALEKMPLTDFENCVQRFIERLSQPNSIGEKKKTPDPQDIWDMRRQMRFGSSMAVAPEVVELVYPGDHWDIAANHLLLAYIAKNFQKPREQRIDYAPDTNGPHTDAIAKILRKWAKAWSVDMREDRQAGGKLDGKPNWFQCMAAADKEVLRYLSQMKVAA